MAFVEVMIFVFGAIHLYLIQGTYLPSSQSTASRDIQVLFRFGTDDYEPSGRSRFPMCHLAVLDLQEPGRK